MRLTICYPQVERDGTMVRMTPTEFERHAGMAASKKWKYTVRLPVYSDKTATRYRLSAACLAVDVFVRREGYKLLSCACRCA